MRGLKVDVLSPDLPDQFSEVQDGGHQQSFCKGDVYCVVLAAFSHVDLKMCEDDMFSSTSSFWSFMAGANGCCRNNVKHWRKDSF